MIFIQSLGCVFFYSQLFLRLLIDQFAKFLYRKYHHHRIAISSLEVMVWGVLGFFIWFCCGCCRIVVHVVAVVFVGLEQPALFAIARFANHCCIFIYLHKIFGVWIGSFIN